MSDFILVAIFLVSTAVIWITGIHLTKAIDHIPVLFPAIAFDPIRVDDCINLVRIDFYDCQSR